MLFLRNFYTVFHSGCTIYIPTNSAKVFSFLHIIANTLFPFLITAILTGGFDLYLIIDIVHLSICLLNIYKTSFSTLFQEWLQTNEANTVTKGFENTFLVPYPKKPVEIEVLLFGYDREVNATMKHLVNPTDILIQQKGVNHVTPYKYIYQGGSPEKCIDVAILAEGYTEQEMDTFYQDAEMAVESMFNHEPFKSMQERFNFVAVHTPSLDSGVSIPRLNDWKRTAFLSHFSTFYSDRYLTTTRMKSIHDALAGIPYEHIIILANTYLIFYI